MQNHLSSGNIAPEFKLKNSEGEPVSLKNYAGSKLILYFFPAAMTPGCTLEAVDFSDSLSKFQKAGYHIIGISPDAIEKLVKFKTKSKLSVTLLSDPEHKTLRDYGAYGLKKLYGREYEGVIRSTFIINVDLQGKGTIETAMYNIKATGHVSRLLKELKI